MYFLCSFRSTRNELMSNYKCSLHHMYENYSAYFIHTCLIPKHPVLFFKNMYIKLEVTCKMMQPNFRK